MPGGPLNINSTNLSKPWSQRESSPSGKIPTVELGIEPGTSCLVGTTPRGLSVIFSVNHQNFVCTSHVNVIKMKS